MSRFVASIVALFAATAATSAFAQTAISVAAAASLEQTVAVSASRSGEAQPVRLLGVSVTTIDREAIEQRQTRIVSDVLRDAPGVAVSRTGAVGGPTQLRLRGAEGNHVLVLIDGIEVSDPFQGEYDFGTLIADEGTRIEVLRGQQSSLYGSDAIGGVIQYLTLGGAQLPGVRARVEGGSFGTVAASVRAAGLAGPLDYALTASTLRTDGTPTARNGTRDVGADSRAVSAKLAWSPLRVLTVSAVGRYSYTDADTNDSEDDATSPLFGHAVDSPGVHAVNEAFHGLLKAEHRSLDGRWSNSMSVQAADTTRRGYDAAGFGYGNKGQRTKASFVSSLQHGDAALRQRVTVAVDDETEKFRNTTPSAFVFQGTQSTRNRGVVGEYTLVANDAYAFGASMRHDDNDRFDDVTTYRVQVSARLASATRLHAAYGTGVKNPGYYELYGYSDGRYIGNPNLRPEKSTGWELGVTQAFAKRRADVGATVFDNELEDEIHTTYPAPDFVATPTNRSTVSTQKGVELTAQARLHPQWRVDAAYTYLKARENGVVEVRRPKSIASVNLWGASADGRLSGTLTVRYNGHQADVAYTDPSYVPVRVELDAYTLVNVAAEYRLTNGVTLYGRIENLLGADYEEVFSFAAPGRAAYVGVRATF